MTDVESLETPDKGTVIVKYSVPYAPALVTWTMGILPEHVYGAGKLSEVEGNTKPVGTGPYKLSRWDIGSRMVLVANDKWWHGAPKIGTVNLIFNVKDELAAIRSGQLDFADIRDTNAWLTGSTLPEFREAAESTSVPGSLYRVIAWNTQRAPFKDQRVRLALTHALNRKRVVDDLLVGWGQLLGAPMFPNMFGIDRSIAPHKFDLAAAKKLLDEAGMPATSGRRFGFTLLTLESQRTPVNEEMLARWRTDLARELNVDLKVEYLPYAEWKERVADKRNFDAAFFGWLPEIPDPDPYNLLHSSQVETGRQNFAGYKSAEADKLLEAARATADRDQRSKIYEQLNAVLHRDLPYTVAYAPFRHYAWSRKLHGVDPADVGEFARFPGLATWGVESAD
jgi:peptide/nickel transport system substrate-binding protein